MNSKNENYNKLKIFFKEEYHSLKAYVNSRINDVADRNAEDIIQDVALNIFSRSDNLSPINNIAAFVYHSIKNKIIDTMRTKTKRILIENESEIHLINYLELYYGHSDNSYSETLMIALKKTILSLKPIYHDIIIAIDFEGHTYKELKHKTGIPEGTLMSRHHRAISILLKKLEPLKDNIN